MPIQNNISIAIACPGAMDFVKETSPSNIEPSSSTGDSSTATTAPVPGPTLTRHDSSLDLTEDVASNWHLTTVTSANGTVEDIYYSNQAGNRLKFVGKFFVAPEYDPNQDSLTGRINPGPSVVNSSNTPSTALMSPLLAKFIPSVADKAYCVIIKVLPAYVFENPQHDFLRFDLFIDGKQRVVRTVSARQMAEIGTDRPWIAVIQCQEDGGTFYWKDIKVKDDEDDELEEHAAWNYDLGTIRVCVERMREEGGEGGGEDASVLGVAEDEGGEEDKDEGDDEGVDAALGPCGEDENDEDEEMEDAGGEEEDDDDDDDDDDNDDDDNDDDDNDDDNDNDNDADADEELTMNKVNVEERCLSHFTATFAAGEPVAVLGTASGRCIDGATFLLFDIKYRSDELLPMVAVVPQ